MQPGKLHCCHIKRLSETQTPIFILLCSFFPRATFIGCICFRVMELLEGKGGFSKGRFQGKANKLSNRGKAEQLVIEHVNNSLKTES